MGADVAFKEEGHKPSSKVVDILQQPGIAVQLSLDKVGCWLVQKAFEVLATTDAVGLALQFRGRVKELVGSPHGNYVLQKMIGVLAQSSIGFIIEELWFQAHNTACADYGCRVLVQLLRSYAQNPAVMALVDHLLSNTQQHSIDEFGQYVTKEVSNTLQLATKKFGHYVLEEVLEHGADHHRRFVIYTLLSNCNWLMLMQDVSGAHVLKKVLECGDKNAAIFLASCLLEFDSDKLSELAASKTGSIVMQALLKHTDCEEVARLGRKYKSPNRRSLGWKVHHKGPTLKTSDVRSGSRWS